MLRALFLALLAATPLRADLVHRETLAGMRGVSLAYDAQVCGVWVASESAELVLLSAFGGEMRRFATDLGYVRAVTVTEEAVLIGDGRGRFQWLDREGRPRDAAFALSEAVHDTEGLHRDADGTFLVVEDDPARLMRVAPDGTVVMELSGDGFEPPMREPQGITRDPYSGNILVVDDKESLSWMTKRG